MGKGPKGVEIKKIGNNEYAYKVTTVWDPEEKKRKKKSKYLGKWKDGEIFKVRDQSAPRDICEMGNIALLWNLIDSEIPFLKKLFPESWEEILLIGFNRVCNPQPLKRLKEWHGKTYLSRLIDPVLSPQSLSSRLKQIGEKMDKQQKFFDKITPQEEKIVYDGSALFTYSEKISLAELGYNAQQLNVPQISLLLAFARESKIPCAARVAPGSIHDVKTLTRFLDTIKDTDAVVVLDRGFLGEENQLAEACRFILPLRRNSKKINYGKQPENPFIYKERAIKGLRHRLEEEDRYIYLYEDILLRAQEENAYHQGETQDFKPEQAGKIALLSNQKLAPEDAYKMYKSRDAVEKAFHVFKNTLAVDTPHLQDAATLRGYVFASFIGLLLYYRILQTLSSNDLIGTTSVKDVLLSLSKVYACKFRGEDRVEEIPSQAEEFETLFNLNLNLFPKTVQS